jgi:excisionase family DNA binding protein
MAVEQQQRDRVAVPVEEAAHLLGIGRTLTFRLVGTGELESIRIGRRRLIPRAAIDAFVRARALG